MRLVLSLVRSFFRPVFLSLLDVRTIQQSTYVQ